jgi:hypothetical protein
MNVHGGFTVASSTEQHTQLAVNDRGDDGWFRHGVSSLYDRLEEDSSGKNMIVPLPQWGKIPKLGDRVFRPRFPSDDLRKR